MSRNPNTRYLRADRVFPADREQVIADGIVGIQDGLITFVGTAEELRAGLGLPEDGVVDYGDATIMPGMIDTHCHVTLAGDRRSYEDMVAEGNEMMALVAVQQLRLHLESGITTIRDNGAKDQISFIVREAARRGYFLAPRMLLSGRPVTHSAGHFHWCNGVADGEDEIRASVRRLVADGADHIKIMASGGGTGGNIPYLASYTAREMRVAVETAHDLDRLTTAHVRAASSMVNGIEAGLDCLEHGEFLVRSPIRDYGYGISGSPTMVYDPSITERMLKSGTYLSFTMQAGGYDTLLSFETRKAAGDRLTPQEQAHHDGIRKYFDMKTDIFAKLLDDGAAEIMSISTDAGPFDISFGNLVYGLRLSVAAGMSTVMALRACTSIAAKICGLEDEIGSLTQGKNADILVVQGDPVQQIESVTNVLDVYLGGDPVPRTSQFMPAKVSTAYAGQC